eukprot:3751479-Amphidinium_carterae.1
MSPSEAACAAAPEAHYPQSKRRSSTRAHLRKDNMISLLAKEKKDEAPPGTRPLDKSMPCFL